MIKYIEDEIVAYYIQANYIEVVFFIIYCWYF